MHKNRYFPDHTIIENVKTTIGHFVQHTFQFRIKHLTFFFFTHHRVHTVLRPRLT